MFKVLSWFARKRIVDVHQKLYQKGFGVGNDGNTSIKFSADRMLVTPTGYNKNELRPFDISMVCLKTGRHLGGPKPSSEFQLHLVSYQHNPSLKAIVHSHPPYSIACSLSNISLEDPILPEVILALGKVPTLPYTKPGTVHIAKQAAQAFKSSSCFILQRHGVVSASELTIDDAYTQLERVEHSAKILLSAHSIKKPKLLSKKEQRELTELK